MLMEYYGKYPEMQTVDVFKYLFHSAFGCDHLVTDESNALNYVIAEYENVDKHDPPLIEKLNGAYSRVHLSCLNAGLRPETLAKLFVLSAKKEPNGEERLTSMLWEARTLITDGSIDLSVTEFDEMLEKWRENRYNAVSHSEKFRNTYRPSYRVIANEYADFLQLFTEIDKALELGSAVIAIEGGSASGKSTLAYSLQKVYGCNVIHMDDFFLRPEQRTPERFKEIGGNVDRERFADEILAPLRKNETIVYSPFDCSRQTLSDPITVPPKKLTVIEGAYSLHPAFGSYYTLSVFLDIEKEYQRDRILKRNSSAFAKRFFEEWIPLEDRYFSETDIKYRADLIISVKP